MQWETFHRHMTIALWALGKNLQVKSREWMWIVYIYGARVLYPRTFTTIRDAIDPNVHLQILCPSLHQIFWKAIDLNVHFQILELFLYVGMNQFGNSSSALFTKNKTCLNVFVGPGDGGLYPSLMDKDISRCLTQIYEPTPIVLAEVETST